MKQRIVEYENHIWLDEKTFLYGIGLFIDEDGDEYSIEVEYWMTENSWHFNRIYECDTTPITDEDLSAVEREQIMKQMKKWMGERIMETVFKNDLISLVWRYDGMRLDMLDSDENYIDYFFYTEDLDEGEDVDEKVEWVIDKVKDMSEKELCEFIYNTFDMFKIEPYCGDEKTMRELRNEWGDEYVVRVGNTAIIVRE